MDEFARTKNPLVTEKSWFLGRLYMFGLLLASGFFLRWTNWAVRFTLLRRTELYNEANRTSCRWLHAKQLNCRSFTIVGG